MTEENMNKVYWVIACIVIVAALGTFIISPAYNKIKAQQGSIETINYTAPSN